MFTCDLLLGRSLNILNIHDFACIIQTLMRKLNYSGCCALTGNFQLWIKLFYHHFKRSVFLKIDPSEKSVESDSSESEKQFFLKKNFL